MNRYERFLQEVEWEMKKKKITRAELAKAVGLSQTMLSLIFSNKSGSIKAINEIVNYVDGKKEV